MARYRIKKVTYKDGEVRYFAQYYIGLYLWGGISSRGEKYFSIPEVNYERTREKALQVIDLCDRGKGVIQTIEFEYVNK